MAGLQDLMAIDSRVFPYAIPFVLLTTLVCGVLPALRATRKGVVADVRQSGETVTPRTWMRQALVVGQLAMSLFLVVATLLFIRSQIRIGQADVGFDLDHGVVARFGLDQTQYPGEARARFAERLVERIAQIPGVSSATMANLVPLGGDSLLRSFHPAGRTDIPGTRPSTYSVAPEYFRTLGIRTAQRARVRPSSSRAPAVAIVNDTFARTYFPGQDVLGQHVQTEDEPEAEVIGVVRDHRIGTIGEAPQSVIYYPFAQRPRSLIVHARASSSPDGLIAAVQRAIDEIDATVPVNVQTLRSATSLEMNMRRLGDDAHGARWARLDCCWP